MKSKLLIPVVFVVALAFLGCKAEVNTPPTVEKKETTIINPPAEKKVENNTTIVNPPAEKK